ncbi:MAG: homocysteine S-methyltransferase family protein [Candidatus Zixiibacteriota bacterium]
MDTTFRSRLLQEPVLFDGGVGTEIRSRVSMYVCEEANLVNPDLILAIHCDYLRAGADVITTNTFCAQARYLGRLGLAASCAQFNLRGVGLAKEACASPAGENRNRWVAGSIGPGISLTESEFDQAMADYRNQAQTLTEAGADLLIIETCQSALQMRAALVGVSRAVADSQRDLPLVVTIGPTLGGSLPGELSVDLLVRAYQDHGLAAIGFSCGAGPSSMIKLLENARDRFDGPLVVLPSAGLPINTHTGLEYPIPATEFADQMGVIIERFSPSIIGGCCGTTPEYIRALSSVLSGTQSH